MATLNQNKMRKTARIVRGFALFIMAGIPLFLIAFWADPIESRLGSSQTLDSLIAGGYVSAETFSMLDKLTGSLFTGIPAAALVVAAFFIQRLMNLFAAGTYISNKSVHYLRAIALSLMAFPPLSILSETLFILAMTLGNPPGQRLFSLGIDAVNLIAFLFGLLLWMITRAFEVEKERAEEHASII